MTTKLIITKIDLKFERRREEKAVKESIIDTRKNIDLLHRASVAGAFETTSKGFDKFPGSLFKAPVKAEQNLEGGPQDDVSLSVSD